VSSNFELTFNQSRNFSSAFNTTECSSSPDTARNELESLHDISLQDVRDECMSQLAHGLVDISFPAAATPMMVDTPQPLWHDSSADLMTWIYAKSIIIKIYNHPRKLTFPVASKVKSSPPSVISAK
jgi:hypothetical protein